MKGYPIKKSWLVRRLSEDDEEWSHCIAELSHLYRPGDEYWFYDEPAPPGVNAGALGVALVRKGKPIATAIGGIH